MIFGYANSSRLQFVVFPLENQSNAEYDWVSYSLPEMAGRKAMYFSGIKIWDPVFLNQQDFLDITSAPDSLIFRHRNRWQWDVAVGGIYKANRDSVYLKINLAIISGKDRPLKVEFESAGNIDSTQYLLSQLYIKIIRELKVSLSTEDSINICSPVKAYNAAYQTYIAGYGLEISRNFEGAASAYHRAIELDQHLYLATCRLVRLYLNGEVNQQIKENLNVLRMKENDPLFVAEVANIYIEYDSEQASKYINSNWQILEKTPSGLKAIGKMFINQGEYQRAIAVLTKAVAAGGSDLDVDFNLGMAYLSTGEYDRATDIFNYLIKFRPGYPRFYSCLGFAHRKAGRLMESCRVLESVLKSEPDNAIILNDLAITYMELKWYKKSIQLLLQALENSPNLHDVYVNLGVAYWNAGNKTEAAKWLNAAMEYPHLRQSVYVNYGNMYYSDGNLRDAIKMYKKAAKTGKTTVSVYHNLAQAYEFSGKMKKAYTNYRHCLELSPNNTDFIFKLAVISEKVNIHSEAEYYYQKMLEIYPNYKPAVNGLVNLLLEENKLEEAVKTLEAYLLHLPSDKVSLLQLADIFRKMQWFEVAIAKYKGIVRDFPEDAEGYIGLGKSIYEMIQSKGTGNFDEAIYALKQGAALYPYNPEPDILIGDIYILQSGYRELAVEHWRKALSNIKSQRERKKIQEKIRKAGI